MDTIKQVMDMIDWSQPSEIQAKGRAIAERFDSIIPFLQPTSLEHNKNVWENCALIIERKSDEELIPFLPNLFEWLQDLNWPGAVTILDRLKVFSGEKLKSHFLKYWDYVINLNVQERLPLLDYLSELLDNFELRVLLPSTIVEVLQKHYHNWCFWDS